MGWSRIPNDSFYFPHIELFTAQPPSTCHMKTTHQIPDIDYWRERFIPQRYTNRCMGNPPCAVLNSQSEQKNYANILLI